MIGRQAGAPRNSGQPTRAQRDVTAADEVKGGSSGSAVDTLWLLRDGWNGTYACEGPGRVPGSLRPPGTELAEPSVATLSRGGAVARHAALNSALCTLKRTSVDRSIKRCLDDVLALNHPLCLSCHLLLLLPVHAQSQPSTCSALQSLPHLMQKCACMSDASCTCCMSLLCSRRLRSHLHLAVQVRKVRDRQRNEGYAHTQVGACL